MNDCSIQIIYSDDHSPFVLLMWLTAFPKALHSVFFKYTTRFKVSILVMHLKNKNKLITVIYFRFWRQDYKFYFSFSLSFDIFIETCTIYEAQLKEF